MGKGKGMLCGEPAFMDQFAGKAADKLKLGEDVDAYLKSLNG